MDNKKIQFFCKLHDINNFGFHKDSCGAAKNVSKTESFAGENFYGHLFSCWYGSGEEDDGDVAEVTGSIPMIF